MKIKFFRNDEIDEFLPDSIELVEKPANPLGKFIIIIIGIFILFLIIWSIYAKVNVRIVSYGIIKTNEDTFIVDSEVSGEIKKINLENNQSVKKGEVLLEVNNDEDKDKLKYLKENLNDEKIHLKIIKNRISGKRDNYNKCKISKDKLDQYLIEDRINKDLVKEIKENNEIELRKIEVSKENLKTSNLNKNDTNSKIGILELQKKQENIKLNQELNEMKIKDLESVKEISEKIDNLDLKIKEITNKIDKSIIKSPVDGIVEKVYYNNQNQNIYPNIKIADIIPNSNNYKIQAEIQNKDISKIEIGQEVNIKINAFNYQKFGIIKGKIAEISPTSKMNKNGSSTYEVEITFKNNNSQIKIKPGMEAVVEVNVGKETILNYFIEPFKKAVDNTFTE